MYFDPGTCPASFLPWLASWLNLELDPTSPESRKRQVVELGTELLALKGMPYGLSRAIETTLGFASEVEDVLDQPFVFRVRVRVPSDADGAVRDQLERLIRAYKPAHAGYVLEVES